MLRPADLAILWDSQNRYSDGTNFWVRDAAQYIAGNWNYGHRHMEQANFLYADGHVKADKIGKMKNRNFCNLADGDPALDRPAAAATWIYP